MEEAYSYRFLCWHNQTSFPDLLRLVLQAYDEQHLDHLGTSNTLKRAPPFFFFSTQNQLANCCFRRACGGGGPVRRARPPGRPPAAGPAAGRRRPTARRGLPPTTPPPRSCRPAPAPSEPAPGALRRTRRCPRECGATRRRLRRRRARANAASASRICAPATSVRFGAAVGFQHGQPPPRRLGIAARARQRHGLHLQVQWPRVTVRARRPPEVPPPPRPGPPPSAARPRARRRPGFSAATGGKGSRPVTAAASHSGRYASQRRYGDGDEASAAMATSSRRPRTAEAALDHRQQERRPVGACAGRPRRQVETRQQFRRAAQVAAAPQHDGASQGHVGVVVDAGGGRFDPERPGGRTAPAIADINASIAGDGGGPVGPAEGDPDQFHRITSATRRQRSRRGPAPTTARSNSRNVNRSRGVSTVTTTGAWPARPPPSQDRLNSCVARLDERMVHLRDATLLQGRPLLRREADAPALVALASTTESGACRPAKPPTTTTSAVCCAPR